MYSGIYDNPYSAYAYGGEQANNQNTTPTINTNTENTEPSSNTNSIRSVVPLTVKLIKMAIQSVDAVHKYYGNEIRSICICGRVQGELKNQLMSYSIHDGTGEINGKIYISQNNDEVTHIQSGYCRIIGNLSSSASSHSINIHHIQPIHSYNEILQHFYNVILSHHFFKQRNAPVPPSLQTSASNQPLQSTPSDFSNTIEMFIIRELQQLLTQHPGGVHVTLLGSALSTYGISLEQVKATLSDMERDSKVYLSDVDCYILM